MMRTFTHKVMREFGSILICLLASHVIVEAVGTYCEEISGNDGNTYIEGSMQQTQIIHESFHKCSMSGHCIYVIQNLTNGTFSLCNSTADLPRNRTGLRIWKKRYHVPQGSFHNCQEAYNKGYKTTSVIPIYFTGMDIINVRCDMVTDGGGWIVFQRRVDASIDFYRGWDEYKNGFGDLNGNFWLGLEKIHKLASPGRGAILRVDIKHVNSPDSVRYAEYSTFEILSEYEGYKLKVGGFSGDAGDSLSYNNGRKFSTKDRDQDAFSLNCAVMRNGAWWYRSCSNSNLNGLYPGQGQGDAKYMSWYHIASSNGGITFSEMKLRYLR